MYAFLLVVLLAAACGCKGEESEALPLSDCPPPNRLVADRCLEPGVQDNGCPAGTLGLEDGRCQAAGVPPELCGDGFEPDGNLGCEPILPSEPCPRGQMAVPGERACHAVMPCGAGEWGDIPIDATTVYVDAFYPGLDSDGTSAKPFTKISDAVAAAAPDALIAIAAGSYVEDIFIQNKAVRLWGKCPAEVELIGTAAGIAALDVRASGTEVHGLALSGAAFGLITSGAEQVLIDRVWVHDALGRGVDAESTLGPSSATLQGSLIEENHDDGVFVMGAEVAVDGVAVRGTLPQVGNQLSGRGMTIQLFCYGDICDASAPATALVRGSLFEENQEMGVYVAGSNATLEGVVVRRTLPQLSDQLSGVGIGIQLSCNVSGCDPAARSKALVRGSLVEENHEMGVYVAGSDVTFEGLVVRRTLPQASDQLLGRGISIQPACTDAGCDPATGSTAIVRGTLLEDNHEIGLIVGGSDATIEGVAVRRTLPVASDQRWGRGIHIQLCTGDVCNPARPSTALVRGALVEDSHEVSLSVVGSNAMIEGVLFRSALAQQADGLYGDGVNVLSNGAPASATLASSRIEGSARAGVSNFGGTVALGATALVCNVLDLDAETYHEEPSTFDDRGNNACGCPDPVNPCKAHGVGLEPPEPIAQ